LIDLGRFGWQNNIIIEIIRYEQKKEHLKQEQEKMFPHLQKEKEKDLPCT
jgi:hypothetical protein